MCVLRCGTDWGRVVRKLHAHNVLVVATMAPLDLDKYAEIAKQCKYLPENDLKVNYAFAVASLSEPYIVIRKKGLSPMFLFLSVA